MPSLWTAFGLKGLTAGLVVGLVLNVFAPGRAAAHPDVWVTVKYLLAFDAHAITEVQLEWTYDVFYSDRAINRYDLDRNRAFSEGEVRALRAALFDPLAEDGYFVRVALGEVAQTMRLTQFEPRIEDDRLVVAFTLTPQTPLDYRAARFAIATHDDAAFDFSLAEADVLRVEGAFDPSCRFQIGPGRGPLGDAPKAVALICSEGG